MPKKKARQPSKTAKQSPKNDGKKGKRALKKQYGAKTRRDVAVKKKGKNSKSPKLNRSAHVKKSKVKNSTKSRTPPSKKSSKSKVKTKTKNNKHSNKSNQAQKNNKSSTKLSPKNKKKENRSKSFHPGNRTKGDKQTRSRTNSNDVFIKYWEPRPAHSKYD